MTLTHVGCIAVLLLNKFPLQKERLHNTIEMKRFECILHSLSFEEVT